MNSTNIIISILLVVGFTLVTISWLRADLKCPEPKIVYRYIPKHPLDIQFGEENNAGTVYNDLFDKSTPWIHNRSVETRSGQSISFL